ncbi:hypothetical protein JNW88_23720, partial [Micromonospora sp. ATA32]|nr:hypothetical protein [Micromonospora sp. ATA32]
MAPPQGQMRPGRQLAVLGFVFVVLYLLVFFSGGASGGWQDRLHHLRDRCAPDGSSPCSGSSSSSSIFWCSSRAAP